MMATGDAIAPRPMLSIDTSSARGAIALFDGDRLSTRTWHAERSHTTTLLAEIHHLLEAAAVEVQEIVAFGIAVGPGAFTGLRAGFGVVKGFHLATGAPLIGVSTLEATALPFAYAQLPVVAIIGAGRGRLVSAIFDPTTSGLLHLRAPRNSTAADLARELADAGPVIVVGDLEDEQAMTLADAGNVTIPPRALRVRNPAALAELAWLAWQDGAFGDAAALEPVYLAR